MRCTRLCSVKASPHGPVPNMPHALRCACVKRFKPERALSELKLHLKEHGLKKESDYATGGSLQPIVIQRPAFDQTVFLMRPPNAPAADAQGETAPVEQLDYCSLPNRALASLMIQRGFRRIGVTHLPEDETKLPAAIAPAERGPRKSGGMHDARTPHQNNSNATRIGDIIGELSGEAQTQ